MLRNNYQDILLPKRKDQYSHTTQITIQPENEGKAIIRYKLRDGFKFLVGAGLTLKNLIFDATDSAMDVDIDVYQNNGKCLKNGQINCCQIVNNELVGEKPCVQKI